LIVYWQPFGFEVRVLTMLMITVETDVAAVTFRLAGRLAGAGVHELARNRSAAAFKQPRQRVVFDLAGLTSVDVLGKEFLAQVHRDGDGLVGGAAANQIVEEIRALTSSASPFS
jgi:ABC-type transporter Mla MlaB component